MAIPTVSDLNISLFNLIDGIAGKNRILDITMIFIADYLIFIIPIFLIYLWFKKAKKDENKKEALFIFASVLISLAVAWGISFIYFHPRPFMIDLGKKLIQHAPDSSFPSDHTTVMLAAVWSLIFLKEFKNGVIFLVLSLLVALARIFCGVHFPFDIIGSIFVSFIGVSIIFATRGKLTFFFAKIIRVYSRLVSILEKSAV